MAVWPLPHVTAPTVSMVGSARAAFGRLSAFYGYSSIHSRPKPGLVKVTQKRKITMAKPIKADPILRGKDAEEFYNKFLKNARLDPVKAERNKKNAELYRSTPVQL